MAEGTLTAEEIRQLRELLDIEAIKKVKLLYAHLMDSKQLDALAEIFTEDAVCEFGPYGTWRGREEIREKYRATVGGGLPYGGVHAITNQWVELTSDTTAVSRTYLHDVTHAPDPRTLPIIWYGIYDEDYRKVDGTWQIARCTLQFLWPQRLITGEWPGPFPPKP
jgi:hypothetical protein